MNSFVRLVKRLAIAAVLTLGATVAFAQEGTPIDVVYLKNGSVVRGLLMEYTKGKEVKIKTVDGSVFVFTAAEVERVAKEFVKEGENGAVAAGDGKSNGYSRQRGFRAFFEASIGGAPGLMVASTPALALGFQVSPLLFLGGGAAVSHYCVFVDSVDNIYHFGVPIFLDIRFDLGRKHSFFMDTRIGGTALFSKGDTGGFFFAFTPGARFAFPDGSGGFSLGLGYEGTLGAKLKMKYKESGVTSVEKYGLNALVFRVIADF